MKKVISIVLIVMTLVGLMIPVFAGAEGNTMYVNCENGKSLNVRRAPNGKVMYRVVCGSALEVDPVVPCPKGWAFVRVPGHTSGGYVMTKFLFTQEPGKYEITERKATFTKVSPFRAAARHLAELGTELTALRETPNASAKAIRQLAEGDLLKVVARGINWSRVVDLSTGRTGYVTNLCVSKL